MGEPQPPRLVVAQDLDPSDIGSAEWDRAHNPDRLSFSDDGLSVEWDPKKRPPGEHPVVWVPASTRLRLHSGSFGWDFVIDEVGKAQIGVGFMLLWDVGPDWGFHGYLGASSTAWAYDPTTGDVVRNTKSIQGGLAKFPKPLFSPQRKGGIVSVVLHLPRLAVGSGRFFVNEVASTPVPLPVGAVVLPAACLFAESQRVTLSGFERMDEAPPR